jgi:tetratricopeptide (TPR) repeat protein
MSSEEVGGSESSPAMEALERGDIKLAAKLAMEAVGAAEKSEGTTSHAFAAAQHDLGMVAATAGDFDTALDAFRKACAIPHDGTPEGNNERLTYMLSLAGVLEKMDRLEEAEKVLRECAEARLAVFTKDHPAYAFALEQYAPLLARLDKFDEAVQNAEQAYAILYKAGHPAVASALVTRAEILKAAGKDTPPFKGLDSVPKSIIANIVQVAVARVEQMDPEIALEVLQDVRTLSTQRFGAQHEATMHVVAEISNVANVLGNVALAEETLNTLISVLDEAGDKVQALNAMQALAATYAQSGQIDKAMETYRKALSRAEATGDASARSGCQRYLGLLLSSQGKTDEAEKILRSALEGTSGEDSDRARVALGVVLQHAGRKDEARGLLQQGTPALHPQDPDSMLARAHIEALQSGQPCGCDA